ncbi:MAG: hypothetical protein JWM75_1769 [Sphingomonas bacterium]|nr:hypothetical protein [Sphingomonas bacterium]
MREAVVVSLRAMTPPFRLVFRSILKRFLALASYDGSVVAPIHHNFVQGTTAIVAPQKARPRFAPAVLAWFRERVGGHRASGVRAGHSVDGVADRATTRSFVAVAEIERFAALRRTIGYSRASALMLASCARLRTALPGSEVARSGRSSIEFVFPARSVADARIKLMAASGVLAQRMDVEGSELSLSVSIGVADSCGAPISDELVDLAEAALAEAQERHLRIVFADPSAANAMIGRLALTRDLASAIHGNALDLHYQPKLRARSGEIEAVEALVRWPHPTEGMVPPDVFVRIAEETGNIRALTEWVIRQAIKDQQRLQAFGRPIVVHVNISALLLPDPDFAAWVLANVPTAGVPMGFEITETAMISDPRRALANLTMFAEAGIRLAIDDYGAGFSSLSYLQQLPVHELKLDRTFVSGLTTRHRDPLLVRSTIDLAHALGMEVTAEGVETSEQLALLQVMGCDQIQGYLIARPMPIEDMIAFIANDAHRPDMIPVFPLAEQLRRRGAAATRQREASAAARS